MSYLVCDKCGAYYELQEGEKPEKFDLDCECGGKLQHEESIDSDSESEALDKKSGILRRIIAIVAGIIIIFVSMLLFGDLQILIPIIAGFVTGYVGGGSYKDGSFNSAVTGGVGGALAFLIFITSYFFREGGIFCAYHTTLYAIVYIIPSLILCLIGGLIAIFIKNKFKG